MSIKKMMNLGIVNVYTVLVQIKLNKLPNKFFFRPPFILVEVGNLYIMYVGILNFIGHFNKLNV